MGKNGKNGNRGQLEIIPFETNDSAEGFMIFAGAPPTSIEVGRSARNDHLFMYNHSSRRFEVLHYGSALIVNMLRLHEPEETTSQRELALFDTDGNFHDRLILREPLSPREADTGISGVRHTAFFDESAEPFTIAVDDIYMLSLAKPPEPNA